MRIPYPPAHLVAATILAAYLAQMVGALPGLALGVIASHILSSLILRYIQPHLKAHMKTMERNMAVALKTRDASQLPPNLKIIRHKFFTIGISISLSFVISILLTLATYYLLYNTPYPASTAVVIHQLSMFILIQYVMQRLAS